MSRVAQILVVAVVAGAALAQVAFGTPSAGEPPSSDPADRLRAAARPAPDAGTREEAADRLRRVLQPAPIHLALTGSGHEQATFVVEVAADPESRRQGLMHREALAPDAGMLFLFARDHERGFWMKDTSIPLSIAFIAADGEILRIMDMDPCEADPCPTYGPGLTYRHALEVNQGAFEEAGVVPGWHVLLPDDLPEPT